MYISLYLLLCSVAISPQEGEICCIFDSLVEKADKRVLTVNSLSVAMLVGIFRVPLLAIPGPAASRFY